MDETRGKETRGQAAENIIKFDKQVKFVCFRLGGQDYALDVGETIEILRLVAITPLPEAPDFVPGIINLRGEIIPVIDLRLRYGLKQKMYNLNTPIMVVMSKDRLTGLIVDEVTEVITIPSSCITANEIMFNNRYVKSIAKYDDQLLLIANLEDLLTLEEEEALEQALSIKDQDRYTEIKDEELKIEELSKTG